MAYQLPWTALSANRAEGTFIPAGPWHPAGGHTRVRGWGEMTDTTGLLAQPAVQVSEWMAPYTGRRKRGAVTRTTTVFDRESTFAPGEPVEIEDAADAAYIRVGWFVSSPSGELVHGYAGGVIETIGPADDEP